MQSSENEYMSRAIELARRGAGWACPNPQVGAVLVKDGRIIGEGWHHASGELHAERDALRDCAARGNDPQGADLYVTLEPCCHTGKQPPCTEAIIEVGIARVFMGSNDPNPLVAGKGIAQLEAAGIPVVQSIMQKDCDAINREWFFFIANERPYVTMKYAMTLDGKIATSTGDSKWVTGPDARAHVHEQRARVAGVMVGIGTVLADDPLLTARPESWPVEVHQPARIVLDAQARMPLDSQLALSAFETSVYLFCEPDAPASRREALHDAGVRVRTAPAQDGMLDLRDIMRQLGEAGLDSVIVEGGAGVHGSLLASGLINRVQAYLAPKVVGGTCAPSPIGGSGIPVMDFALPLEDAHITQLGDDFLIEGEVA